MRIRLIAVLVFCVSLSSLLIQGCAPPEQDVKIVYKQPGDNGGGQVDDVDWQDIYQQSIKSVVKVEIYQCFVVADYCFQYGHGSGFVVADGVVATNWHVAEYFPEIIWNQFPDEIVYYKLMVRYPAYNTLNGNEFLNQLYEVQGVVGESGRDIAFLQVETLDRKPLPLVQSRWQDQQILDEVMAMGYPLSYDFVAAVGNITALLTNWDVGLGWVFMDTKLIKIDAQIDHGNSGGPLLNKKGEVIGINFAGVTWYTVTHNFALTADYLSVYNLNTLDFQVREVPDPRKFQPEVIFDSNHYIDLSGSVRYEPNLMQGCVYTFVTTGVDYLASDAVTPVGTYFSLYHPSGWWLMSAYPNSAIDVYTTEGLYPCAETGDYSFYVNVYWPDTNYPGYYNLKITEYCPVP